MEDNSTPSAKLKEDKKLIDFYHNLTKELKEKRLILENVNEELQRDKAQISALASELHSREKERVLLDQKYGRMMEEKKQLENDILNSTKKIEFYEKKNLYTEQLIEKEKKKFEELTQPLEEHSKDGQIIADLAKKLEELKNQYKLKLEKKAELQRLQKERLIEEKKEPLNPEDETEKIRLVAEVAELERQVSEKRQAVDKVEKDNMVLTKRNNAQLLRLKRQIQSYRDSTPKPTPES